MTEKEAIAYLRNTPLMRFEDGSGVHSSLGDAMRMAVKALERMMPKKPEIKSDFMEGQIVCPECGSSIGLVKWREEIADLVKNCRECGQRLEW